jgi:predicted SAM-dependent methyltransferase
MYVQYGCGFSAPSNWTNFDSSPTLWFERLPFVGRLYTKNSDRFPDNVRYGDVVSGLPITSNSCDGVYASHVLEHLSRQDIDKALAETYRILKPDGIFRLVVPDLELAARQYIDRVDAGCPTSADRFVWDGTMLGRRTKSRKLFGILYEGLGTHAHLWMWDFNSLAHLLNSHRFVAVRRSSFNDCSDNAFSTVEELVRFEGALAIEAKKPL